MLAHGRLRRTRPRHLLRQGRARRRRRRRDDRDGRASAHAPPARAARGRAGPRGVVDRLVRGPARARGPRRRAGRVAARSRAVGPEARAAAARARGTVLCATRCCGATRAPCSRPPRPTPSCRARRSAGGPGRSRSPATSSRSGCGSARTRPDLAAAPRRLVFAKDWLRLRLTGQFLTDRTEASASLLYDVGRKTWSPELLRAFDVPVGLLPEVVRSSDAGGRVTADGAPPTRDSPRGCPSWGARATTRRPRSAAAPSAGVASRSCSGRPRRWSPTTRRGARRAGSSGGGTRCVGGTPPRASCSRPAARSSGCGTPRSPPTSRPKR